MRAQIPVREIPNKLEANDAAPTFLELAGLALGVNGHGIGSGAEPLPVCGVMNGWEVLNDEAKRYGPAHLEWYWIVAFNQRGPAQLASASKCCLSIIARTEMVSHHYRPAGLILQPSWF